LGGPVNAVYQANIIHIDDAGDSCDGRNPEDSGSETLNYTGIEANFPPSGAPPTPFLIVLAGAIFIIIA